MNGKRLSIVIVACVLALVALLLTAAGAWAAPLGTREVAPLAAGPVSQTLSYQGYLTDPDGTPLNGSHVLAFRLYADAEGGTALSTQSQDVTVEDGLFTAQLDVSEKLLNGQALWLGIQVEGDAQELAPRQPLLPAPYAFYALGAPWTGLAGVPLDLADGDDDTLAGLKASTGQVPQWDGAAWTAATIGADAWLLGGNAGTQYGANVLGTLDPVSLTLAVSGTPALRLEYSGNPAPNLVAGYTGNGVTPGAYGAVIAGGGREGTPNSVTGNSGTVSGGHGNTAGADAVAGGGVGNTASGLYATVDGGSANAAAGQRSAIGGGANNTTSGDGWYAAIGGGYHNDATNSYVAIGGGYYNSADGQYATVGGGYSNTVSSGAGTIAGGYKNAVSSGYGTVGGGYQNAASGYWSTVGGGYGNSVSGSGATVPGGYGNEATGLYSLAAGADAHAVHTGSFVWSSGGTAESWYTNTFTARAPGGVRFYSQSTGTTGVQLSANGTSWGVSSDRNIKEGFQDVDLSRLLQTLAGMPIQSWKLKAQDAATRHIGPVAQDFNSDFSYLFGEPEDALRINSADETGVALAAAQGLYDLSQQQAARIDELEAENATQAQTIEELQAQLADLAARVAALEGGQ